jgi:hypothetical protein
LISGRALDDGNAPGAQDAEYFAIVDVLSVLAQNQVDEVVDIRQGAPSAKIDRYDAIESAGRQFPTQCRYALRVTLEAVHEEALAAVQLHCER